MLSILLEKNRHFNPTYSHGKLTNHLSMALIALDKIGASEERLQAFFEKYSQNLKPLVPTATSQATAITTLNWIASLGNNDSYSSYLIFFTQELKSLGLVNTLKQYLPTLMKGIATDAFHCVIRLAYAIEIDDEKETSCALAYFASSCTFLTNGVVCATISDDPKLLLNKIRDTKNLTRRQFNDNALIDRFIKVTIIPEFTPIINWLLISESTLKDCAKTAISLYAATNNFTALHLVTATHALRLLLPYLPDTKETLRYYWQAFCAAYISIGAPEMTEPNLSEYLPISWEDIFSKAIKANDDHTIKLVYSCYSEDQVYKNPLYNYIASHVIKKYNT